MKDIREQIKELVKPYKSAEELILACENLEDESALIILLKELFDSKLPNKYKRLKKNKNLSFYWSYWYAEYFSRLGFNCYVFSVGDPAIHSWIGALPFDKKLENISQQDMNSSMWCIDSFSCALHNMYINKIGNDLIKLGYKKPNVYLEDGFDFPYCKTVSNIEVPNELNDEMLRYIDFLVNGNYIGEKIPLEDFDKLFSKSNINNKKELINEVI